MSTEGVCIISLLILVSCNSVQNAQINSKKYSNNLELSLIKDIQDGLLDMPLEQACLIASGVDNDKKMQKYLVKMNLLITRIDKETDINKATDPLTKAKILFHWLQENTYEGIYNDCYDIRNTLNLRVGNCLSYAIQFTTVCRHFGIDIKNIFIPGHIYSILVSDGQTYYFEHTHSDGIVKQPDKNHPDRRVMKDTDLISEIFLYRACNANSNLKYEESIKYCQQALLFNPHDNRPIILLVDNYLKEKNYKEAFQYLDNYLSHHPGEKKSFANTYILLQKICKKEDNKAIREHEDEQLRR